MSTKNACFSTHQILTTNYSHCVNAPLAESTTQHHEYFVWTSCWCNWVCFLTMQRPDRMAEELGMLDAACVTGWFMSEVWRENQLWGGCSVTTDFCLIGFPPLWVRIVCHGVVEGRAWIWENETRFYLGASVFPRHRSLPPLWPDMKYIIKKTAHQTFEHFLYFYYVKMLPQKSNVGINSHHGWGRVTLGHIN